MINLYAAFLQQDLAGSWNGIFTIPAGSTIAFMDMDPPNEVEFIEAGLVSPTHKMAQYATLVWSIKAEFTGELDGISGQGQPVEIQGTSVLKFRLGADGLLDTSKPLIHTTIDWSKVLAQLGVPVLRRTMAAFPAPSSVASSPPLPANLPHV